MSWTTTIMGPEENEIIATSHPDMVMAFSLNVARQEDSSQADLFIIVSSCEWDCHSLVTEPGYWPSFNS